MPSEHPHSGARRGTKAPGTLVVLAAAAAALSFAAFAIGRPLLYGATAYQVLAAWAYLGAYVVLPGVCAWRWLRPAGSSGGALEALVIGWPLGHALQVGAFVGSRALHVEAAFAYWPLVVLPLALLARRRARGDADPSGSSMPSVRPVELLVLLAIAAAAVLRARMKAEGAWWLDFDFDTLFHAANTATIARGLPYEEARVAEAASNYHYYSYAFAAGLREVAGVPVAAAYERVIQHAMPVLLALQVFALAREVAGRARAGLVAAALVVLHADLGFDLMRLIGPRAVDLDVHSYLEYGIYRSPSMVLGLVFLVALAHVIALEVRAGAVAPSKAWRPSAPLVVIAVLSAAASGTKGTVMPVAVGAGVLLLLSPRARAQQPFVAAVVTMAVVAAPMTAILAWGGESTGQAIFRFAPWHALYSSGAFAAIARSLGGTAESAPRWLEWVLCVPWSIVYFGPCAAGAVLWLRRRGRAATTIELYLGALGVTGTVAGFALGAAGVSELFFADCAHVALAVLAAAWLSSSHVALRARVVLLLVLGAAPAAGCLLDLAAQARRDVRAAIESASEPPLAAQYRAGLEWIRDESPEDAVILGGATAQLYSPYCERRAFYEIESTLASSFANGWRRIDGRWWSGGPYPLRYPERAVLRDRWALEPSAALVREARALLATSPPVYALLDRARLSHRGAIGTHWEVEPVGELALEETRGLKLVFENAAVRIYALDAESER